jgi:hypothetical protein
MNFHVILGMLGSGAGPLSKELCEILAEKNQAPNSAAQLNWGMWGAWEMTGADDWPVSRVIKRARELAERNPELTDIVITGPWILDCYPQLDQLEGSVTVYWVDRVDAGERTANALEFWDKDLAQTAADSRDEFIFWMNQQEQLWQLYRPSADQWQTLKTLIWDQDSAAIEVLASPSNISYLKCIAIDYFK